MNKPGPLKQPNLEKKNFSPQQTSYIYLENQLFTLKRKISYT